MKIRSGFVSNSSSSSFVLKLAKPIEEYTYEEFEEFMDYKNPIKRLYKLLKEDSTHTGTTYIIEAGSANYDGTDVVEIYIYDNDHHLESEGILIDSKSHH